MNWTITRQYVNEAWLMSTEDPMFEIWSVYGFFMRVFDLIISVTYHNINYI